LHSRLATVGITDLVVFVYLVHPAITLFLGDNLARVLHDDLVGFEAAVGTHSITSIFRLEHFNTGPVSTTFLGTLLKILESSVGTQGLADVAVGLVAFIQHDPVLTLLCASIFGLTHALGLEVIKVRSLLPIRGSVTDETV
jgi:hypothetical protein